MKKNYDQEIVKQNVPMEPIPKEVRAKYLRPGELLSIQEKFPVAFQPLGTIEWHGRQNPLGCDSIKVEKLSVAVAEKVGGVVMPTLYFATDAYRDVGHGIGLGMDAAAGFQLPGSFYSIDADLYKKLVINACQNYLARGFKLVVLISGHNAMTQDNVLSEVCYTFKEDDREPVCFIMEFSPLPDGHPLKQGDHAAYYETSMMLFHNEELVNMNANKNQQIESLAIAGDRPYSDASAEDGAAFFEAQVEAVSEYVKSKLQDILNK